jgi:2-keto-4-pentenoate hydratase/2-oxohepta-3-ene-1,7-dioic acid hydratase in catechol pathway
MKWVRFNRNGTPSFGVLNNDTIVSTSLAWTDILAGRKPDSGPEFNLNRVRLLAPVERPGKLIAIGKNYWDHCRETNSPPPDWPIIFTKFPTAIIGPGAAITWSAALTREVDFEAELGVVIGRTARRVAEADALDYVFGYTAANDVSARDLQFGDGQWVRGKSLDTFCPLGPALVTAGDIPDPQQLAIRCELNGATMQDSNTSEMIFNVAHLVSFCSQAFTLEPGDVIVTGTPHGVGAFRDPKVFMKHGDQIVVEIGGIGRLANPCVVED